jgi:signal transduction histidine kinase
VTLNLIVNGIEAMGGEKGGRRELRVTSARDGTAVLVAVKDTGPGIDPAQLDHLFDAFYTTKPNGIGMGLAICRSIIEAHGGRLWAAPGEKSGAVFQFTLPCEGETG